MADVMPFDPVGMLLSNMQRNPAGTSGGGTSPPPSSAPPIIGGAPPQPPTPPVPPSTPATSPAVPPFPILPPINLLWRIVVLVISWAILLRLGHFLAMTLLQALVIWPYVQDKIGRPLGWLVGGTFVVWSWKLFFPKDVPPLTMYQTTDLFRKKKTSDGISRSVMYVRGPGQAFTLPWEIDGRFVPIIQDREEFSEDVSAQDGGVFHLSGVLTWIPKQDTPSLVKYLQSPREVIATTLTRHVQGLVTDRVARQTIDQVLQSRVEIQRDAEQEFWSVRKGTIEAEFGIDVRRFESDLDPDESVLQIQNRAYELAKFQKMADGVKGIPEEARRDTLTYLGKFDQKREISRTEIVLPDEVKALAGTLAAEVAKNPKVAESAGATLGAFAGAVLGAKVKGQKPAGGKPAKPQEET